MLLTIYEISESQLMCGGCPPPEGSTVVWQGSHEEFESLGFNSSQVGGFKMIDGKLTFDSALKEKREAAEAKPNQEELIRSTNLTISEQKRLALAEYFEDQMNGFGIPLVVFYEQLASEVRTALQQSLDVAQKKGRAMSFDYVLYKIQTAPKFPEFTDEQFQKFIGDLIDIIQND